MNIRRDLIPRPDGPTVEHEARTVGGRHVWTFSVAFADGDRRRAVWRLLVLIWRRYRQHP